MHEPINLKTIARWAGVILLILGFGAYQCYSMGYEKAEHIYKLELSEIDRKNKQAIIDAQFNEKEKYELKTKALVANYNNEHKRYSDRVRQLEAKLRTSGDLEAVTSERDRCLKLAVEGEALLREAEFIVESLK